MCQFTRILWDSCSHQRLSMTPEHTLLCTVARVQLRQGIDCAPAECHPLSKDVVSLSDNSVDPKIAQTIYLYVFCDDCINNPDVAPDVQKVGTPIIPPVEVLGSYFEVNASDLASLRQKMFLCNQKWEFAVRNFEEELVALPEIVQTKITEILDKIAGTQLLTPDTPKYHHLFRKSLQVADSLQRILYDFMDMRVPESLFSELYDVVCDKLHHKNKQREIFCQLAEQLSCYKADPSAYEAAVQYTLEQLAQRMGYDEPDFIVFAALQRTDSIDGNASTVTVRYAPRSSFGTGKKKKPYLIHMSKAGLPPSGTKDIMERLKIKNLEVIYTKGLATRASLSPLNIGQGPWGIRDVLFNNETAILTRLEQANKEQQSSGEEGRTVAADATFMGHTLPDNDSEISEEAEIDAVDKTEEKVDDQQESVLPSNKEITLWKGSREGNPRKRTRLERRA